MKLTIEGTPEEIAEAVRKLGDVKQVAAPEPIDTFRFRGVHIPFTDRCTCGSQLGWCELHKLAWFATPTIP